VLVAGAGIKKNQAGAAREKQGRNACSRFLIVDAQRVSGIKHHIAADTMGLPHALAVSTADVTDWAGALQALKRDKAHLDQVQSVLCDGGYTAEPFAQGLKATLGEHGTVQIAKRNQLHSLKVMPKRWLVERSFAWLEKNRRLWSAVQINR